jgi:hypothetical protein
VKRLDTSQGLLLPPQNRPHRARNVLALSDVSEPTANDLGRSEPVSDDLIWWLHEDMIGDRIMLFAGDGVEEWLESAGIRQFEEQFHDGQVWYARLRRNGKLDRTRWRFQHYQLLGHSKDQYALIRWSLKMMDAGWSPLDVYGVIDPFWTVHKGQPPLTVSKIILWIRLRGSMVSQGMQWP